MTLNAKRFFAVEEEWIRLLKNSFLDSLCVVNLLIIVEFEIDTGLDLKYFFV